MAGAFGGEVAVLLLHPLERFVDGGVAAGQPPGEGALLIDPAMHAFRQGEMGPLGDGFGRRAEAFNGHQLLHGFRVETGVAQGDVAAERVGDDGERRHFLLMDQLGEVVDVAVHPIAAILRPLAVAMAAQVWGDDVPVFPQVLRHPVPVSAMVPPAMQQQQRWRFGVAPIDIVQPQPLGEKYPGGRAAGG